ncbi:MAG: heme exporter protein CcmB [Balneolaceae bacterium]
MLQAIFAVFKKDFMLEMRTRYALNTMLAFTGSALLLILFTLRAHQLDPTPKSGLVWIIILFAAMAGMARSFVQETDQKTWLLLHLHGSATDVYTGKLLYNFLFLLALNLFTFALYIVMMNLMVVNVFYLINGIVFGALGLAAVTTLTSAMISRADRRGAVFSVLCIPLLVPLLLILTRVTRVALVDGTEPAALNDLMALVGFAGVTITTGILLFEYIWETG